MSERIEDGPPLRYGIDYTFSEPVRNRPRIDNVVAIHVGPVPLLTESAGYPKCADCGVEIQRGEPCVDLRDETGDVLCVCCGDERNLL